MMHLPYATSTGSQNADGQAVALECAVTSIELKSDGTNAATLSVYDGTSTSGVLIASLSIPASTAAPQFVTFNIPVCCTKGVYADVGGTGATYIIQYIAI